MGQSSLGVLLSTYDSTLLALPYELRTAWACKEPALASKGKCAIPRSEVTFYEGGIPLVPSAPVMISQSPLLSIKKKKKKKRWAPLRNQKFYVSWQSCGEHREEAKKKKCNSSPLDAMLNIVSLYLCQALLQLVVPYSVRVRKVHPFSSYASGLDVKLWWAATCQARFKLFALFYYTSGKGYVSGLLVKN